MSVHICYQFRERAVADELARGVDAANAPLDDYDRRVRVQESAPDAEPLKMRLRAEIEAASALVCIVGPTTATSSWVGWEIGVAAAANKRLVVLRASEADQLPAALQDMPFEAAVDVPGCLELLARQAPQR
jgi:hypothetical protein